MYRRLLSFLLSAVLASASLVALGAECSARSGPHRVALLELYTSEGCSSCPPADRWLSGVAAQGSPPLQVVPLALHVDYWDYIGWQDRFARAAFSARQRDMAKLGRAGFVYTPQVMVNGQDTPQWGGSAFAERIRAVNRLMAQANIRLSLKQSATSVEINADADSTQEGETALYVALYENGLSSDVKRGENSGAKLHHDYVVREWLGPIPLSPGKAADLKKKLSLPPDWNAKNMGAAAFVQNRTTGEVVQAMSMKLCDAAA
ncbi:MAG: DUF1223 domain-containing protein [Rhodocyclaceae bacterium]|nr:MAG: DUF1223 domain-containing protein [Rhodocyclaceae bacterium]